MSVKREDGEVTLECDECGEDLGESFEVFQHAVNKAVGDGWSVKQERGVWTHLCEDCRPAATAGLAAQRKLFGLD